LPTFYILRHENCHISLTATHEIFIFIPLDENKPCIHRKKLEYPLYTWLLSIHEDN
jgi:hypothetical protein